MIVRPPSLPSPSALGLLGLLSALSVLGCRDLDGFDTKPGEAYCGVIGSPAFQAGFLKQNQPPDLALGLTLDMNTLTSLPGTLTSGDALNGMCATPDAPQRLFDHVKLRAIPEVDQDVISALTFGEGHLHDFFAWVDSSCQGTMLAVVSLLKNNQVELRLFKPARMPQPNAPPFDQPGFVVFHLRAQPIADCQVY
ncbi:MAG: hypothetical protein ABW061_13325 [Polyangiaceae bacterium]